MNEQRMSLRGVKPSTIALFWGTFGALVGVAIAILYALRGTINYSASTDSLLQGLLFGMSIGVLSLLVLPIIYFAVGWVLGLIQGMVWNAVLRTSGGIEVGVNRLDAETDSPMEQETVQTAPAGYNTRGETAFGEQIERRPPNNRV